MGRMLGWSQLKVQFLSWKTYWRNVPRTQSKYTKRKNVKERLRYERQNYLELRILYATKTHVFRANKAFIKQEPSENVLH